MTFNQKLDILINLIAENNGLNHDLLRKLLKENDLEDTIRPNRWLEF